MFENIPEFLKKPLFLFSVAFSLGTIIFFPLDQIQQKIVDILRKSGTQITMGPIHRSMGLFPKGGLFGVETKAVSVSLSPTMSFDCDEMRVSPQWWRVLLLQLRVAIRCEKHKAGGFLVTLQSGTGFSMKDPKIAVSLNHMDLESYSDGLGFGNLKGIADGSVDISGLAAMGRTGMPGRLDIDVNFDKLQTPGFNNPEMGLSIPTLALEKAKVAVQIDSGKIHIDRLSLGSSKGTPIHGEFKGDLTMNPGAMFPSGVLAGKIKVDPDLERAELKDLKLYAYYGPIKQDGYRIFKKKELTGSPLSMLSPPTE